MKGVLMLIKSNHCRYRIEIVEIIRMQSSGNWQRRLLKNISPCRHGLTLCRRFTYQLHVVGMTARAR